MLSKQATFVKQKLQNHINNCIDELRAGLFSEEEIADGVLETIKKLVSEWTLPDDREKMNLSEAAHNHEEIYVTGIDKAAGGTDFTGFATWAEKRITATLGIPSAMFQQEMMCTPAPTPPRSGDVFFDDRTGKSYKYSNIRGWLEIGSEIVKPSVPITLRHTS